MTCIKPSGLAARLNLYVAGLLLVIIIFSAAAMLFFSNRIARDRRNQTIESLGTTLARLIARPVSVGDFLLVEDYIKADRFSKIIGRITVSDGAGQEIARSENPELLKACPSVGKFRYPISAGDSLLNNGDAKPDAVLMIEAGDCEFVREAKQMTLVIVLGGIFFIFASLLIVRRGISHELRPLFDAFAPGSDQTRVDERLIESAPIELRRVFSTIKDLHSRAIQVEGDRRRAEIAAQVAHDIRSPVAALKSAARGLDGLPEDYRLMIRSSVNRIQDIASNLIEHGSSRAVPTAFKGETSDETFSVQLISTILESTVAEKRLQFRDRPELEISFELDPIAYGLFVRVQTASIKRVLSNLLNNAIEALNESRGKVEILLSGNPESVSIDILDDGRGIDPKVIPKLMVRGASFGKSSGSGLGLFHAKEQVERSGGLVEIRSKVGNGTRVTITLPRMRAPDWFASRVTVKSGGNVVVVDDDEAIHTIWQSRFSRFSKDGVNLRAIHLASLTEFAETDEGIARSESTLYLVDHEFVGSRKTGLDSIESLGIQDQSILVTSHSEEIELHERCLKSGVKLLPKTLAGIVPIEIS